MAFQYSSDAVLLSTGMLVDSMIRVDGIGCHRMTQHIEKVMYRSEKLFRFKKLLSPCREQNHANARAMRGALLYAMLLRVRALRACCAMMALCYMSEITAVSLYHKKGMRGRIALLLRHRQAWRGKQSTARYIQGEESGRMKGIGEKRG